MVSSGPQADTFTTSGDSALGDDARFDPRFMFVLTSTHRTNFDSPASSIASSTVTVEESVYSYTTLYGRTYQVSPTTEYWGPNDETQSDGLDLAHEFITMLLGDRLFEAPIVEPPQAILDVGTGTGLWAINVADRFPETHIIGTDISAMQPCWVPPNCFFQIDDVQLDWTFGPSRFDLVHIRSLGGSVADWRRLYQQAYRSLQPGGWIEHFEFTTRLYSRVPHIRDDPDHIFHRWADTFNEAGERMGKTLRIGVKGVMRSMLRRVGYVNIIEKTRRVPVGGWGSDARDRNIGIYNLAFMVVSLEGFALFMLHSIMGWDYERVQVFVAEMRGAIMDTNLQPYYYV